MRWDVLASVSISFAALCVGAASIHREFFSRPSLAAPSEAPRAVRNFDELVTTARWNGQPTAKVRIIEFADFECPFCKRFDTIAERVKAQYGTDVAIGFVHYPLSFHRFAMAGARGAECAARESKFDEMKRVLFQAQDSLGLIPWSVLAARAKLKQPSQFEACVFGTAAVAIDSGIALGKRLQLEGTPTVVINGMRYASPPYDSLEAIVQRLLKRGD
jgi:protein-disulfide isomerase